MLIPPSLSKRNKERRRKKHTESIPSCMETPAFPVFIDQCKNGDKENQQDVCREPKCFEFVLVILMAKKEEEEEERKIKDALPLFQH